MDMSQYMEVFVDEGREHLQTMNQKLIELEKDPENRSILDSLFRVAHTLKGMSATMGYQGVSEYTHKMENVLDVLRQGKAKATAEIIDLLLEGADALEEFIESVAEGEEVDLDFASLQKKLESTAKGIIDKADEKESETGDVSDKQQSKEETAAAEAEAEAETETETVENGSESSGSGIIDEGQEEVDSSILQLNEYEKNIIADAKEKDFGTYYIEVTLDSETLLKGARAFMVFQKLEEIGEIIKSDPDVEAIEDEDFEDKFNVIIVTKSDADVVKEKVELVSEIEKVIIASVNISGKSETPETNEKEPAGVSQETALDKSSKESSSQAITEKGEPGKDQSDEKEKDSGQKIKTGKTVRVDIERLDKLMNLVSELVINKTRLEQIAVTEEVQGLLKTSEQFSRITSEIQNVVMQVRMVPLEQVFSRFPRMVRDLSRSLDKEVEFTIEGEETELDRSLIDEIGDPLMHLIRNSIDHGIEDSETRKKNSKPAKGKAHLKAYHNENNVVIEVEDDGKGMDAKIVRQKALEKGVIDTNQSEKLSDSEVLDLLFEPGFSTSDKVSDVSGRGVGLDVVKSKIEGLGGRVEIDSVVNQGSKFTMYLPLTLAIIQALMVKIEDEQYAVPLAAIEETTLLTSSDIDQVSGQDVLRLRDRIVPIVNMKDVLKFENDQSLEEDLNEEKFAIIVSKGDKKAGLIVDELIGQQEVVIKSLGTYLGDIKGFTGATILGDGRVALILDVNSLIF
ncbi:chemotaxis protein CheA [Natranaerofaba carboxydovora]|uniref:chemotaxis protein CheA n=1 Tax=Natranaerofaba carboxydovora TaxID=2742683 RepID=UPI001F1399D1|nr:chemotaxis protein CheA [Natranaerofaba carboxydovora]UMZ73384.1 Chemotaxis protein CheA [Natranaerofaba carboxydovora]